MVQAQYFGTCTRCGLEIWHQCGKRVKAKSQKDLVATSYVCRSKTGRAGREIVLLQIFEIITLKVKWKKDWILSVSNGIRTNYHFVRKRIQYSIISANWPNELSGCGFESLCCHLNLRYRACFEQGVTWYPSNYRV